MSDRDAFEVWLDSPVCVGDKTKFRNFMTVAEKHFARRGWDAARAAQPDASEMVSIGYVVDRPPSGRHLITFADVTDNLPVGARLYADTKNLRT